MNCWSAISTAQNLEHHPSLTRLTESYEVECFLLANNKSFCRYLHSIPAVPASQCNEVPDCLDLSDEIGCSYSNKTTEEMSDNAVGCYPTDFRCPNVGQGVWCIRQSHVCNGYNDCVGGADESAKVCRAEVLTLSIWLYGLIWLISFL